MSHFLLKVIISLMTIVFSAEALSARWTQHDVPKGGFSKRGREEAARKEGRKYSDPYENSGGGYGNVAVDPRVSYLFMAVAFIAYLFMSGWLIEIEVRIRSFFEHRRRQQHRSSARPATSQSSTPVIDESLRRARIARFAAD